MFLSHIRDIVTLKNTQLASMIYLHIRSLGDCLQASPTIINSLTSARQNQTKHYSIHDKCRTFDMRTFLKEFCQVLNIQGSD